MVEYANGLVMLEGDKKMKEAEKLYADAAACTPARRDGAAGRRDGQGRAGGLTPGAERLTPRLRTTSGRWRGSVWPPPEEADRLRLDRPRRRAVGDAASGPARCRPRRPARPRVRRGSPRRALRRRGRRAGGQVVDDVQQVVLAAFVGAAVALDQAAAQRDLHGPAPGASRAPRSTRREPALDQRLLEREAAAAPALALQAARRSAAPARRSTVCVPSFSGSAQGSQPARHAARGPSAVSALRQRCRQQRGELGHAGLEVVEDLDDLVVARRHLAPHALPCGWRAQLQRRPPARCRRRPSTARASAPSRAWWRSRACRRDRPRVRRRARARRRSHVQRRRRPRPGSRRGARGRARANSCTGAGKRARSAAGSGRRRATEAPACTAACARCALRPPRRPPRSRAGSPRRPCRLRGSPARRPRAANGSTPLAAIAPSSTALTTVPACARERARSSTSAARPCRCSVASSAASSMPAVAHLHLLGHRQRARGRADDQRALGARPCPGRPGAPSRAVRTTPAGRSRRAPGSG